jgi:hypothetical protein
VLFVAYRAGNASLQIDQGFHSFSICIFAPSVAHLGISFCHLRANNLIVATDAGRCDSRSESAIFARGLALDWLTFSKGHYRRTQHEAENIERGMG